jgi:glycosyltransferase involved in cell wall biosynthesis
VGQRLANKPATTGLWKAPADDMRICLVYDCLFPYTVGGAERWYRNLALRLRDAGHEVTYLTLRQWEGDLEDDELSNITVKTVGPRMTLYTGPRRRILPPLVFGAGVAKHLAAHGPSYDVVHTASFPYFSLLAAAAARRRGNYVLVADWHEVWSAEYWREYLGRLGGAIGHAVQRACARRRQRAFCFSKLHARRLREEGLRGEVTVLEGEFEGPTRAEPPLPADPVVVFAGRHIPEKRAPAVVPAVQHAARRIPGLRGVVYGDGPERHAVLDAIDQAAASDTISAPGFVNADEIDAALRTALCMLLPSRREGYGLIVVEAASLGVPSVVVDEPDNAATELISPGENGFVAASAQPEDLAAAIVAVHEAGPALRQRTADWYTANAKRLSLESSLERVLATYDIARS